VSYVPVPWVLTNPSSITPSQSLSAPSHSSKVVFEVSHSPKSPVAWQVWVPTQLNAPAPERKQPVMWVRPPDRPGPRGNLPDLAIREGQWKLLVSRQGTRAELFDVLADPREQKNLAAEHPDVVQRLSAAVIAWDKSIPPRTADSPAEK